MTVITIPTPLRAATRSISLEQLKQRLDARDRVVLVDVREREEYRRGHLPGALSIPRDLLELEIEREVPDRATSIVTYCAGGTRSALAAKTLAELGYTNVETANPGFSRWRSLGYPIVVPPGG